MPSALTSGISTVIDQVVWLARAETKWNWELESVLREVRNYGRLEDNWDGEGACTIKTHTVDNACLIAQALAWTAPLPDASPNPHGTIGLEWESEAGYAYVEVGTDRLTTVVQAPIGHTTFTLDRVPVSLSVVVSIGYQLRVWLYPNLTGFLSPLPWVTGNATPARSPGAPVTGEPAWVLGV